MTGTAFRVLPLLLLAAVLCCSASAESKDAGKSFAELGLIPWHRDHEAALAEAKKTGKPLMILTTELPGCNSCKVFGEHQLSHPLVLDASAHFVPVVMTDPRTWPTVYFKKVDGKDAVAGSPLSYSGGRVYFGSVEEKNMIPLRIGFSRVVGPLLGGMVEALEQSGAEVPLYLKLAAMESGYRRRKPLKEKAAFGTGCFWFGEAKLGCIEGVIATRCGFFNGEVVQVTYNPTVISYRELVEEAQKLSCAKFIVARTDQQAEIARDVVKDNPEKRVIRSDDEVRISERATKYHLKQHLRYYLLPLTELQATRINASLRGVGPKPEAFLSPTQLDLLKKLSRLPENELRALRLDPVRSLEGIGQYAGTLTRALGQTAVPSQATKD